MPESAIASGCVDLVLSPEGIAVEIAKIAKRDGRDVVQAARG
jgi:chemotaxis response regulator CheB